MEGQVPKTKGCQITNQSSGVFFFARYRSPNIGSIGTGLVSGVAIYCVLSSGNGIGINSSIFAVIGVAVTGGGSGGTGVAVTGLGAIVLITGDFRSALSLVCTLMTSVGVAVVIVQLSVVWHLEHCPRACPGGRIWQVRQLV